MLCVCVLSAWTKSSHKFEDVVLGKEKKRNKMLKTRTRWKLQTCTNWFGKSGVAVQHTPHLVFYHIASQPSVPKQQSLVCWLVGGSDAHNSFFSLAFMYFNVRFSMSCLQTHIHTNTQLGLRLRFYFKHLKSMPSTIHVLLNILVQAKHWDGITKQKTAAKLFLFCFFACCELLMLLLLDAKKRAQHCVVSATLVR